MGSQTPTSLLRTSIAAAGIGLGAAAALLAAQAAAARSRRHAQPDLRLAVRATIGDPDRPSIRLVLLGDATALGVGVTRLGDTLGGQLAELLAAGELARRVEVWSVAVALSRSADLGTQVARALVGQRPDVAVILVGSNDVVHGTSLSSAAANVALAVHRLRRADVATIVGTCPDLGALPAFNPPLRNLLSWYARRLAHRQVAAVRAAGGVAVDLGAQTGTVFRADPGTICPDGFHPSADGYRILAHALFPAVEDAARSQLVG